MAKIKTYKREHVYCDEMGGMHTILVYGELTEAKKASAYAVVPVNCDKDGGIYEVTGKSTVFPYRKSGMKTFNFGWAVCMPCDEYDEKKGIEIAKRRFSRSGISTYDGRLLSEDIIYAILDNEINYIINNRIEKKIQEHKPVIDMENLSNTHEDITLKTGVFYKIEWNDNKDAVTYAVCEDAEKCYWALTLVNGKYGSEKYFNSPFLIDVDRIKKIEKATRKDICDAEQMIIAKFRVRWNWKIKQLESA